MESWQYNGVHLVGQKVLYRTLFLRDCHPHLLVHLEAKKWMDF
jgi:hypothetical protein